MSVCPSVLMKQLENSWTDYYEEFYEVSVVVRSDMTVTLYKILMHFCAYFAKYASEREIFRTNVGLYEMHIFMYRTLPPLSPCSFLAYFRIYIINKQWHPEYIHI